MSVIYIKLSEDLPTRKQNELRYRLEMARWKARWREAELAKDYAAMDRLNIDYKWLVCHER